MKKRRSDTGKYYRPRRISRKKPIINREIKPGAGGGLKKIFEEIGIPERKPFRPDPFQLEALSAIERSDCLVTAPTGAGKTWIAEQAIAKTMEAGGISWYASPLKALSNSKYNEFSNRFGPENVGILTGDRKENPEAPVIVGTTEILRNQLYDSMHSGKDLGADFVILDEAHYLGDEDRGVVWEEVMIYLPVRIPLLMLSATIGNAREIARWLTSIRSRECVVVLETKRPAPLVPLFFHPSGTLFPLMETKKGKKNGRLNKKVKSYVGMANAPLLAAPRSLPPFGKILTVFRKYHLLPAIFFLKSRADCDNALKLCRDYIPRKGEREANRLAMIEDFCGKSPHIAKHKQQWYLKELAVGSHHSGQLPGWKIVVENLMSEGLLDAVFATSTVAAGVNFPARTVVFLNSDKFNGMEFLPLNPTEFHQMTGRAGRRGMDKIGFAVVLPGKFMNIQLVGKLVTAPASAIHSQIRINFSMVLNLLLSHTPEKVRELLEKSFATFQMRNKKKAKNLPNDRQYLWKDFFRHLEFLKMTGYVGDDDRLTPEGLWASQLRVDQPLLIAEGFRTHVFPESDECMLAAIMAAFVNEDESNDRMKKEDIPRELPGAMTRVREGLRPLVMEMIEKAFEVRPIFLRPAAAIFNWCEQGDWEKALNISEMAEGNFAMLILRTADNLRHIRALSQVFPEAATTAGRAIDRLLKDPVTNLFD